MSGEERARSPVRLLQRLARCLDAPEHATLRATLLRKGYGRAAAYVVVAVVGNHVRRVLAPGLGQFVWHDGAVAHMKLARWAPHALLEASLLDFAWAEVGRWACQRVAVDVGRAAVARLRRRGDGTEAVTARDDDDKSSDVAHDARCVFLALASLALLERRYVESCWATAHVYASARLLLSPRPCDAAFVRRLVVESTPHARTALQAGLVLRWLARSWRTAARGKTRVLLPACTCAAGTVHVLRNSGRYFLLLEMSDGLVTWAWMVLGMALLAAWAVGDWARLHMGRGLMSPSPAARLGHFTALG